MKTRNVISAAFSILFFVFSQVYSQCPNSYFKTVSRSLVAAQTYIYNTPSGIEDFNNDGRLDLVAYKSNERNLYIYLQTGQNKFGNPVVVDTATAIYSETVKFTDFESDGDLDLVIYNSGNPGSVTVYKNNGAASFTPLTSTTLAGDNNIVSSADINGDGISDLFTFQNSGGAYYYRLGNASGTFGLPVQVENAEYRLGADFNRDGRIDFPRRNNLTGKLEILYNQGNGVFTIQTINTSQIGEIKAVKDVNNDNFTDVIAAGNSRISVILNTNNNNFTATDYSVPVSSQSTIPAPQFGDFNGDGFLDIMTTNGAKPYYSIFKNNGAGVYSRTDYNVSAPGLPFGDIDGDHKTDLISNGFGAGNLFGHQTIVLYENTCLIPGATKIVDFDGDRVSDRTVWNESQGLWKSNYLHLDNGSNVDVNFYWGTSGDITTPGDYDGDGKTDYAVFRPSNGVWYIRRSSDQSVQFISFGTSGDIPVASDFDGDEKTDIAVFRPSNGGWYILKSSNGSFYGLQWGLSGDKPLSADFDGDGKADIAVYRPSNGNWYILRSSNGSFYGLQWGIGEDKPLPADYDGDGKADIAVYRPSQNLWYIQSSYNNQFLGYSFGIAGDVIQPGDWNGDGAFDIGVYRPTSKIWYYSASSQGALFGSDGDMPIATLNNIF